METTYILFQSCLSTTPICAVQEAVERDAYEIDERVAKNKSIENSTQMGWGREVTTFEIDFAERCIVTYLCWI